MDDDDDYDLVEAPTPPTSKPPSPSDTVMVEAQAISPIRFEMLEGFRSEASPFLLYKEVVRTQGFRCVLVNNSAQGTLYITSYRLLFLTEGPSVNNLGTIPAAVIDTFEFFDGKQPPQLRVTGKDLRVLVFSFTDCADEIEDFYSVLRMITMPSAPQDLYAFSLGAVQVTRSSESRKIRILKEYFRLLGKDYQEVPLSCIKDGSYTCSNGFWRVSSVNSDYKVCSSYPFALVIPAEISDEDVKEASKFRTKQRLPAISWCNKRTGAVIARSSQPRVGTWRNRSTVDEKLVVGLCKPFGRGSNERRKLYIFDAREWKASTANRFIKGGGVESTTNYPACEEVFHLGIVNIHQVKSSFDSYRDFLNDSGDGSSQGVPPSRRNKKQLLGGVTCSMADSDKLHKSEWLLHIHKLLSSASFIAQQVAKESAAVLVHCSDGWDRTSQLVSLSTILLDPYYRSVRGFQVLIEKDWIAFGHQFAQRTGVHGRNELSPIFMQFVDCVGQLISKYPLSFEFTEDYLVALLDMVLSGQFGAFLCDSDKERDQWDASISFECLWTHFSSLRSDSHINHNYRPDTDSETISFDANGYRLHPLRKLHLRWRSLECSNSTGWND